MKVIVCGYYGKQNAGDDLLQHSISSLFSKHRTLFTSWLPSVETMNSADLIAIGGGSIWPGNAFFELSDQLSRVVRTPIMVIGISAKKQNPEILAQTRRLIDRSIYFHVRDKKTASYFACPTKVRCGPDLFWWTPFGPVNISNPNKYSKIAINLRQWDEEQWSPGAIIEVLRSTGREVEGWPLHFGAPESADSMHNDATFLAASGTPPLSSSFSLGSVLQARFVVAMRFHAIQVAVRLERPVIGYSYHPKTTAFFVDNGIPELCVSLSDPAQLSQAIKILEGNFYEYQRKFLMIKNRLLADAASLRNEVTEVINSISPKSPVSDSSFRRFAKSIFKRI